MTRFRYYLTFILLAPGIVAHELSHLIFCLFAGVRIYRVALFRFSETAGFVVHEEAKNFLQALLISTGPLTLGSLASLLFFSQITFSKQPVQLLWLWLGIACALAAIPSNGDAQSLFKTTNRKIWRNPLALIAYPFVILIYILNFLKRWHIDILFAGLLFWLGALYLKN